MFKSHGYLIQKNGYEYYRLKFIYRFNLKICLQWISNYMKSSFRNSIEYTLNDFRLFPILKTGILTLLYFDNKLEFNTVINLKIKLYEKYIYYLLGLIILSNLYFPSVTILILSVLILTIWKTYYKNLLITKECFIYILNSKSINYLIKIL